MVVSITAVVSVEFVGHPVTSPWNCYIRFFPGLRFQQGDPMRNQIVPWFGSKAALSRQISVEFGPHKSYFEPFAGGLGMLIQKPQCRSETVNDLHQDVVHLARVLANAEEAEQLREALDRRLCCEQLDREARERLRRPFSETVDRATDFFYVSWMATSGVIGSLGCTSMAHGYGVAHSCASKLRNATDSITAFHQRLRGVTILNRDGFTLLDKIHDAAGIVLYCDPPYLKKGGKYCFDFEAEHHERLAAAVRRFQHTRVIVSYTDHPLLDRLYAGWTKKRLDYESRSLRRAKVKTPKPPEVLLINGPMLAPQVATHQSGDVLRLAV